MKKVATVLANGFEEIEAWPLSMFWDVLGSTVTLLVWKKRSQVLTRSQWKSTASEWDLSDYDGIFLPGGMPGAANLRDNPELIAALKKKVGKEKSFLRFVQHQLSWHVPAS